MFGLSKKGLLELAKSLGRFLWFGLLGLIVAWLQKTFVAGDFPQLTVLIVGFVVKAIDQYIHHSDKTESNGLALPFLQG